MSNLTQETVKEFLDYNPDTGYFTWIKPMGYKGKVGQEARYIGPLGYGLINLNRIPYLTHRLVWLYVHGEFPKEQIDHINHVRSDNRLINLRSVSSQENQRNRSLNSNNKSGLSGVHWNKTSKKWISRIKLSGKLKHLGTFADKFEAICARKSAEVKYCYHKNHGATGPRVVV